MSLPYFISEQGSNEPGIPDQIEEVLEKKHNSDGDILITILEKVTGLNMFS
jgi:hypothetical protein